MDKQFYFLSGLPRTGSTLLSSILSQNPNIHAEGASHVCELMRQSFFCSLNKQKDNWNDIISISEKQEIVKNIIKNIPYYYYESVKKPIILDKSRIWTLPENNIVIKNFLTENPKTIVLIRPLEEIVASFVKLRRDNNWHENDLYDDLLDDGQDPIMLALQGAIWAKENNNGEFLFINYEQILFQTEKTIEKIYDFCDWPKFKHQFENIQRPFIQNDNVVNLKGLHDVRKKIDKKNYQIYLPKNILKKCYYLNSLLFED
jgi:sulfotransferase